LLDGREERVEIGVEDPRLGHEHSCAWDRVSGELQCGVAEDGDSTQRARHWDDAYATRGGEGVSWYQPSPRVSLELTDVLGVPREAAVIDVGGGASRLVDELVGRGFSDVTVLDVSVMALGEVERRLPADAGVAVLQADVLEWHAPRRYDLWHDRAALHFLVDDGDRGRYLEALQAGLAPGGAVIVGAFAPDAPEQCSGLPVRRYSADDLAELLGSTFELAESRREEHVTPFGAIQPFTWVAGRLGAT